MRPQGPGVFRLLVPPVAILSSHSITLCVFMPFVSVLMDNEKESIFIFTGYNFPLAHI